MLSLTLATSGILGLLAFFEPCTIATNTLFSARNHSERLDRCCRSLLFLWLARSLLLSLIFVATTVLLPAPQWSQAGYSLALGAVALIYLLSRFLYLPVPHFDFARLLPGGDRLPYSIRLGLMLPACTLPLVAIIALLLVRQQSVGLALAGAGLFASLFTLPMAIASLLGLGEGTRVFLSRAARLAPWLTAALLFGAAIWPWVTPPDLAVESLDQKLSVIGPAALGIALLVGFLFSFNPVSFAAIPVMLAYVTRADKPRQARLMAAAFVTGLISTHVLLGVIAALGGEWVSQILGRQWAALLGPVLILLGLSWAGWIKLRLPWFGIRGRRASGVLGAFLLGIPFSIAVCPFCTPALLVTLTASAASGSVLFGALLLFAFALGRSIPIVLGALSMSWLETLSGFTRHQKGFEIAAGITLILSGLYLLNEYFLIIPAGMSL
jgi:cytochrome c-type biogenesis protein